MLDLLIRGGTVFDGSGAPGRRIDLGIADGLVEVIGPRDSAQARQVVDAGGLFVSPGFIDVHSHSDLAVLCDGDDQPKLRQGVTTEIVGQDGLGAFPVSPDRRGDLQRVVATVLPQRVAWDWQSLGDYFDQVRQERPRVNVAALVPHGALRVAIRNQEARPASRLELERMCALLQEGLAQGALGLSTGLIYAPCSFADPEELVALCSVVARHHGVFAVHLRSEGARLLEAAHEVLDVARRSGVHLHFSHVKALGVRNRHLLPQLLDLIDSARAEGLQVTADQYPYTASATMLTALLPGWAMDGGVDALLARLADASSRTRLVQAFEVDSDDWENRGFGIGWHNITVTNLRHPDNEALQGRTLSDLAEERGTSPAAVALDLIASERGGGSMIQRFGTEEDLVLALRRPDISVCSDGVYGPRPHPRLYGTFPRVLGRYVREQRALGWESAILKMTGLAAQQFGLDRRGLLREGYAADVVVFDPSTVIDRATYEDSKQQPDGIRYVIVNGAIALDGDRLQSAAGQVLHAQAPQPTGGHS